MEKQTKCKCGRQIRYADGVIIEGEKRCSNCDATQEDHIDFYDCEKSGKTCPYRKSMKFLEREEKSK